MALKMRKNTVTPPPEECPLGTCLSIISGAWAPNVIWYLSEAPRRFSELKSDIPGVSSKMLTARLKDLQQHGVISRTVKPTSPPSVEYALTDLGLELVPAINAIIEVGHKLKKRKEVAAA
ncbi:winged helix-turn-helix transcriptional regulator [Nisaea denitrificans]|uniref:winged helix-turn-helix transcriptional regulator n=1 Tax=Nisaea denitrificans TaxID=390877 RepID=UPI0003F8293E|nr:helix-turn-helix domain-containing protein [Nisaea denitrificans]